MTPLERCWLLLCVLTGVITFAIFLSRAILHDSKLGQWDLGTFLFGVFATGITSLIVTMFLIGIPSRIAMNLLIQERRRRCWQETMVLVATFAVLGWMLYSMYRYPPEG